MASSIIIKIKAFKQTHPNYFAAVVFAVLTLIFISPSFFQGRYLAPVDTSHYVAPYLDITTQMLPWYKLSGELIKSGRLPFWNVFSGQGLPLMANMQSAIFFPLTWLFFFLPIKFALLFYSFIKLWLLGMLTYLYLKEMKVSYYSSLIGGMLFAFCGANVIWFLWPLTSVILILPLSFFLIERYFNRQNLKTAAWLTPITALGLFAGHPQTFFYIFCAIYAYTIFKSFFFGETIKQGIKNLATLSGFFLLGLLMSAIAVLPFLEYLKLSANLDYRAGFSENPFFLPKLLFLANLIPDFYGNTGVKNFSYLLVPNYGELALGYIGVSGLILSLFAFGKKIRREIIFFGIMAALALALIYHAPIIYQLINKLPGFGLNYNNRLLYLWAFFVATLASFGLDNLLNLKISPSRFKVTWLGVVVFSAIVILANKISTKNWDFAHNLDWHTVSLWQNVMIVAFLANLVIAYLALKKLPKQSGLICVFILIFIETGIHGMIFMKTSRAENFYPNQPALSYLQNQYQKNQARVFTYGDNLLPNIGTWYHINELSDHDTIYLKSNKQLKNAVANYNYSPEYTFSEPNLNALRFLSVKYLLYPKEQGREMLKKHPEDINLAFEDENYMVLELNVSLPRAYLVNASNAQELNKDLADLIQNSASHQILPVSNYQINETGQEKISYFALADSYLITTDNYYPGWIAKFSNNQTKSLENAYGLRAIAVAKGQGSVEISYQANSFWLGLKISLAALLIWLALVMII